MPTPPTSDPSAAGTYDEPALIPAPRGVRFDGRWAPGFQCCDAALDPSLPPLAYRISIDGQGRTVARWGSPAGEHLMRVTCGQLGRWARLVAGPDVRPVIEIEDEPAFASRGLMLDVSRDKVPTFETLVGRARLLRTLKINHAQLYTEHTFAYTGHEPAWLGSSPIVPREVEMLVSLYGLAGIDLAPNQNCFGHLSRWLRLPQYAHLAETHGAWKFLDFDRSGPFSLCPIDERSEAFVTGLLAQLCPLFQSPVVNIGCDETFDVGFGRSSAEVDRRAAIEGSPDAGRASLYFEFVNKIAAAARSLGKRPMLWADIALSHPQMLDRWPRDPATGERAVGLAWGYEPDAPFASWCELLARHDIPAWVCPGTSTWRSFAARTTERRANLRAACAALHSPHPPRGFLLTDWGDGGHMQHWIFTQLALAEGAHAAWRGELPPDDDRGAWLRLHDAIDLHVFDSPGSGLAAWLSELGDIDLPLRRGASLRNQTALFIDLFPHTTPRKADLPRSAFEDVGKALVAHAARLPRAKLDEDHLEQIDHTVAMMTLAVEHALATRPMDGSTARVAPSYADRARLIAMAETVKAEHRRLWSKRNRPGGLDDSCSHLKKVIASLSEPCA